LYLVGRRYYPIPYEYIRLLKVIFVCGVLFAARVLLGGTWSWEVALIAVYPAALWATGFFNAGEVAFVRRYLRLRGS